VSGQGALIALVIAERAIRGSHPEEIGPAVVEAISQARRQAFAAGQVKLQAVLDKDQEWQPQPQSPQPALVTEEAHGWPARPPSHREPLDDEQSFEEIDFLSEPGYNEQDGQ
jgi:hypothetical protein